MKEFFKKFLEYCKMSDKRLHFSFSAFIAAFLFIFLMNMNNAVACVIAIFSTLLIGIIKELYDKIKGGPFDYWDLIFDAVGAVSILLPILFGLLI